MELTFFCSAMKVHYPYHTRYRGFVTSVLILFHLLMSLECFFDSVGSTGDGF